MTRLVKIARIQLPLPLELVRVFPHPLEQVHQEAIEALAELLLEAMGPAESTPDKEVGYELEDHA
jgi:hypothetical protein